MENLFNIKFFAFFAVKIRRGPQNPKILCEPYAVARQDLGESGLRPSLHTITTSGNIQYRISCLMSAKKIIGFKIFSAFQ